MSTLGYKSIYYLSLLPEWFKSRWQNDKIHVGCHSSPSQLRTALMKHHGLTNGMDDITLTALTLPSHYPLCHHQSSLLAASDWTGGPVATGPTCVLCSNFYGCVRFDIISLSEPSHFAPSLKKSHRVSNRNKHPSKNCRHLQK